MGPFLRNLFKGLQSIIIISNCSL